MTSNLNPIAAAKTFLRGSSSARRWFVVALVTLHVVSLVALMVTGKSIQPNQTLSVYNAVREAVMSPNKAQIELSLAGTMQDKASQSDKQAISNWIASGAGAETYRQQIQPIIQKNCLACHNGNIPHAPNLDGFENLLKVSRLGPSQLQTFFNSQLTTSKLYLLAHAISMIAILILWIVAIERDQTGRNRARTAFGLCIGLLIVFYGLHSLQGLSALPLMTGLLLASLVFCVCAVKSGRPTAVLSPASGPAAQPAKARRSFGTRKFLLWGLIALAGLGVIGGVSGYAALQYVRENGFCLGAMCHHTGQISEFEKIYWQIESAEERAKLPLYKTLKALPVEDRSRSQTDPSETRFKTWEKVSGDAEGTRYSSLSEINLANISELEVAWEFRAGGDNRVTLQTSPIVVGPVLYSPAADGSFVALNAKTGAQIWRFKPTSGAPAFRGLSWWKDAKENIERLFFIAGNKLHSLDAKTGRLDEQFGSNGTVTSGYSHPAPVTTETLVIIAKSNAQIEAFDIRSGDSVWTFETRKLDSQLHRGGERYSQVGSNIWSGMSIDHKRGLLFASVGNPREPNYGALRPGPNLYSNSVIAIDVTSGKLRWHFQETAHDLWDMDVSSPPVLTSIRQQNQTYDVVATTTKAGNTLLLDRVTGGLIHDFRLRRAPTSKVPGEKTWPYQPDTLLPQPFASTEFSLSDVTDIGEKNRESVLRLLKGAEMGFFVPPVLNGKLVLFGMNGGASWPGAASDPFENTLYIPSNRFPWLISLAYKAVDESRFPGSREKEIYQAKCAACHGDNREGVYEEKKYIPSLVGATFLYDEAAFRERLKTDHPGYAQDFGLDPSGLANLYRHFNLYDRQVEASRKSGQKIQHSWIQLKDFDGFPGSKPPWGLLTALDLSSGQIKWQVPFGNYESIGGKRGQPTGQPNAGGALVTAGGLLFATGTVDKKLRVFDKSNGKEVWSYPLPYNGSAPPITFEIDGKQYVVVQATGRQGGYFDGLGDAMIAFTVN